MDFVLRANLRLSKFVPDEFVRIAAQLAPEALLIRGGGRNDDSG